MTAHNHAFGTRNCLACAIGRHPSQRGSQPTPSPKPVPGPRKPSGGSR